MIWQGKHPPSPDEPSALERCISGYRKFRAQYFSKDHPKALYQKLVKEGQSPKIMVIACSDARVDPSIIFHSLPGELFIVRNVANLVPPCDQHPRHHGTSAALEFAVKILKVEHIIILGHSHCGGIQSLLTMSPEESAQSFIASWMNIVQAAKEKHLGFPPQPSLEAAALLCEERSLVISLNNLRTFPWIAERVAAGHLSLHAWHFDLKTGKIRQYCSENHGFELLGI